LKASPPVLSFDHYGTPVSPEPKLLEVLDTPAYRAVMARLAPLQLRAPPLAGASFATLWAA
jgi:hypothetical protein